MVRINLVGLGPGDTGQTTRDAYAVLRKAPLLIGAKRMLSSLPEDRVGQTMEAATPDKVYEAIRAHADCGEIGVVFSGDVGFYSGAKRLLERLDKQGYDIRLYPGISTPQYFAARLLRPWQHFHLVSGHGIPCHVLAEVLNHRETFFLTGGDVTPQSISRELEAAGLGQARIWVGENLSGPEEQIARGTAAEFSQRCFGPLCAVLVENERTFRREFCTPGIEDQAFIRGEVPMTKREVRVVALSLLGVREEDILYDVGAGTGSVAVEMALLARRGRVYAFECKEEACRLIEQNRDHFGVYNLQVEAGMAPEAFGCLPAPEGAFIGGSKGQMRPVMQALVSRNSEVRMVVSAVSIDSLGAAVDSMKALDIPHIQVCQVAVSRSVERGGRHMMTGLNPVFLISGGGRHG